MSEHRQDLAFISYHDKDRPWLERLEVHLEPLLRRNGLSCWNNTQVRAGDGVQAEVERALSCARVFVLLVSADYLASAESTRMLREARARGVALLWLPVRPCAYEETELAGIAPLVGPARTLALLSEQEAELELVHACRRIAHLVHGHRAEPPGPPPAQDGEGSRSPAATGPVARPAAHAGLASDRRRQTRVLLGLAILGLCGGSLGLGAALHRTRSSTSSAASPPSASGKGRAAGEALAGSAAGPISPLIRLQLDSQPQGATVYLVDPPDDEELGATPIDLYARRPRSKLLRLRLRKKGWADKILLLPVEDTASAVTSLAVLAK